MASGNGSETRLDPSKTALPLVHWQKEIATPGGRNSEDIPQRLLAMGTIDRTQAVLSATRKNGMMVVYVNGVHRPGYPELAARTVPLAAMLMGRGSMLKEL